MVIQSCGSISLDRTDGVDGSPDGWAVGPSRGWSHMTPDLPLVKRFEALLAQQTEPRTFVSR